VTAPAGDQDSADSAVGGPHAQVPWTIYGTCHAGCLRLLLAARTERPSDQWPVISGRARGTRYGRLMAEAASEFSPEELGRHPDPLGQALRNMPRGYPIRPAGPEHQQAADTAPTGLLQESEETVSVLSDAQALKALLETHEAATRDDVIRALGAVRALLDERS
jgi:hypothetical protein